MPSPASSGITPDRHRPGSNLRIQTNNANDDDDDDSHLDLLMRHSSPIDRRNHPNSNNNGGGGGNFSPITVRNSSPSHIGLSRPRSNPRNRTPMRYESPLPTSAFGIPEEGGDLDAAEEGHRAPNSMAAEGRRITILPMAGSARGTNIANFRNRQDGSNPAAAGVTTTRSRKQGPSHRKQRRWNNANFVNLAKEVGGGSGKAAEALLRGHAHAGQYRCILSDSGPSKKKNIMTELAGTTSSGGGDNPNDEELRYVRDKFFEGELHSRSLRLLPARKNHRNHKKPNHLLTRDDKLNRIDKRLRQVVTRAIENSLPATRVMETFEDFLIRAHTATGEQTATQQQQQCCWNDLLSQPPTISRHGDDEDKQIAVLRFSFGSASENGGFHRLLLHALVQFHGLSAHSATTPTGERLLTATGHLADTNHKLVDSIMQRKEERLQREENRNSALDVEMNRLNALKV